MKLHSNTIMWSIAFGGLIVDAASGGACSGGSGDCCVANGTPGCNDDSCCSLICALDETCCASNWDDFCVTLANLLCDVCTGGPAWGIQANGLGSAETLAQYLPTAPGSVTTVGPLTGLTPTQYASGLAWTPESTLWMVAVDTDSGSSELHRLDPSTGGTLVEMPITGLALDEEATDLAYNPLAHAMNLLTVQCTFAGCVSRIHTLDLVTGDAVQASPLFPGQCLGLAITSAGHLYIEDVTSDVILHLDASHAFVDSLPLGFNAAFNQGLGAHWSFDDRLALAANGGGSYTFLPDLSGFTFRGIIGGGGSAQVMADVAYRPLAQPCPWDCDGGDGIVGINDFLELLAQWGGTGTCDFDGGGVGINTLLDLLANWGPCP